MKFFINTFFNNTLIASGMDIPKVLASVKRDAPNLYPTSKMMKWTGHLK